MASTSLTRTFGQTGNRTTMTFSAWVKKAGLGSNQMLLTSSYQGNSAYQSLIFFDSSDRLVFKNVDTSSTTMHYVSTRVFRDTSAWYHVVWAFDTTQSTAANRVKLYVNGEQITSFSTETIPSQNADNTWYNLTQTHKIGVKAHSNSDYFDGAMSHIHFIDGTAYTPSAFGETDTTTGEWKAKTSPSVTYGTNGFFILKDSNSVTDQSGNSNNWTVGSGTLTSLKDNPDNVFTTMNPLDNYWQGSTFSNGNNTIVTGSNSTTFNTSTLLMTSGKYYVEVKPTSGSATLNIGVTGEQAVNASQTLASRGTGYAYVDSGSVSNNGSSVGGTWSSYANGDIIGIAINLDDEQDGLNKLYFSKNGVWQNGADPSTPSSVTGVVGITKPSNLNGESKMGAYAFAMNETWNDNTRTVQWNFGNGYFGTTAVSSVGTNASDNGIFEYDVPTGYTALSTKGLNS